MYDLLIKNGTVFDGLGNEPKNLDILIKNERIVKIGNFKNEKANIEINAEDLYVSPGFIEINSLADRDFSIFLNPQAENYLLQGVTTVIGGACGASLYPLISGSLESLNKWVDYKKINVKWQRIKDFFEIIEKRGIGVNFGGLISWSLLRSEFTNREFRNLTNEEKEKLKFIIKESLKEGALGVAFGLGYEDEKVVGVEEMLEIANIVKSFNGYLGFNLRDETDGFLTSLKEIIEVVERGQISSEIYQLKVLGKENFKYFKDGLRFIEQINKEKELLNFDISPYEISLEPLMIYLPDWAAIGGFKVFLKNIKEKVIYQKLIDDLKKKRELINELIISDCKNKPVLIGKSLKEIAKDFNLGPEEAMVKILEINEGRVFVFSKNLLLENIKEAIKSPYSFISSNSGFLSKESYQSGILCHPQSFGAFIKFLKDFVIDKKIYSFNEAIYKLTGKVAQKIGLKKRGVIKENNFADIVIFSPSKLNSLADFSNPYLPPLGIDTVIINGKITYRKGIFEKTNQGKIIKRI